MQCVHVYNIWEQNLNKEIEVSCFLPTGILILLRCSPEETITNIKTDVWKHAKNYPLFKQMLGINYYMFRCINQNAEQEDLFDEKRRLCDVQPFSPVLRLVVKADDVEDKILNGNISQLIDKGLHEFDSMENEEVDDFRKKMLHQSGVLQKERNQWNWDQKASFLFPPQLEPTLNLSESMRKRLHSRKEVAFSVRFRDNPLRVTVIKADPYEYPSHLVKRAIAAVRTGTLGDSKEDDFVMKIRGKQEFLLGNRPLCEYKYIRQMISRANSNQRPELVLVKKASLRVKDILMDPLLNSISKKKKELQPPPTPPRRGMSSKLSWDIHEKVRVTIHRAWNVNVDNTNNLIVRVRAGIFHGGEQLGECFITTKETLGHNPEWNEWVEAQITVSNLPRMARLCLAIGTTPRNKPKKTPIPLAWVNTTFFNFKNQLQTGKHTLYMWPALEGIDLNPLGTVESNPDHRYATAIEISFGSYVSDNVLYPPLERIMKKAEDFQKEYFGGEYLEYSDSGDISDELRSIIEKDPLEDFEMQEKEKLWKARNDCREHIPHSLPRLLQCVQWDNSAVVAQMQALLQNWPELKPEEAIELLDYKYADNAVRKFAVMCLDKLTDIELSQYLLQLVQALKYETHLDCDLGRFLLRRALKNQTIGHFFFWHLRAEMHNQAVSTRFGLLLEGYCRCNIPHMRILTKQVESLGKMLMVNTHIKSRLDTKKREELLPVMADMLRHEADAGTLTQFVSPLSPSYKLEKPKIPKCKFMNSKMAPLYLVFQNEDPIGDDVFIMFKNGDDLRQDMLTLQVMEIMDNLWKDAGLDLRLIPYRALATGNCSGLIEIVTHADTIAKIQWDKVGRFNGAFKADSLFEWLKEKNVTDKELDRAVEDFTYSCAGYCVATYVLGIGDRHNDNIMIKETGQLFHIDFGHFLGKFKSKFGVKRERVPFVLTHDFVHVITRGNKKATKEFEDFKICCERAFMILRRHGNLLITLFAMMLSSGIPELSDSTIHYLRESLVLDKSDEVALKHFRNKFNEALRASWKTSVNWWLHLMAKYKASQKKETSKS